MCLPGLLAIASVATVALAPGARAEGSAKEDPEARAVELYRGGKYRECAQVATEALEANARREELHLLHLRAHLAVGEAKEALEALEAGLERYPWSIRLRLEGLAAWRRGGEAGRAEAALAEIEEYLRSSPWRYRSPRDRVAVGRFLLSRGADPRQVLEEIYDRVKEEHRKEVEAWVASGDLALQKSDWAVAARELEEANRRSPGDPDILYRLGRARAEGDAARAEELLRAALERNPRHTDSLLWLAEAAIDREEYDEAGALIARALAVCPGHSRALAYRAVLAHLRGRFDREKELRRAALASWARDPEVDHLIGRKLSQKYRFAEGAAAQRRALALDPGCLPARLQLAQDLLRLGREEEGWRLVSEVYEKDGYSVLAHNLDLLREHLEGFRTLEGEGIRLRMEPREAAVYGARALALLERARRELSARYRVELGGPITVEIFPEQKDFAIRTFGLPGGSGFLGVCFGAVITAPSPAARRETPSSWEAVLWHELCHAVTLAKSRNRMPRWLSEGISVWEERREDPSWGQAMEPRYLELIDSGGLTPLSRLSGAFLHPPTPLHLEFAYYEASLVVEFLAGRAGLEGLRAILDDLGRGEPASRALERRAGPLAELEKGAEVFVRARADELRARADWSAPGLPDDAGLDALAAWCREHPKSYPALARRAGRLVEAGKLEEAAPLLRRLIELGPGITGAGSAYDLLARVERERSDAAAEKEVLREWTAREPGALAAGLRLLELSGDAGDPEGLALAAERVLAIDPLLEAPHRELARAAEALGTPRRAIPSYRALLAMGPVDPAGLRFRLARALRSAGDLEAAKRELLGAIEEAPRFRQAHRELLAVARELDPKRAPEPSGEGE